MERRRLGVFIIAGAILLTGVVAGCHGKARTPKQEKKDLAIPVRTVKIKTRDIVELLEYVGSVKGQDEAIVYPKVSGKIIEKVKEEGSPVKKGDPIVYIDRDEVGLTFEKAPVESPLSGVVGRVYVDIGSSVTPQTQIALVSDMGAVTIDLSIPEKYAPMLSIGQGAVISVDAYPGVEFAGSVTEISPMMDIETRSAPIEITIEDKEGRLRSGMFAKVKITLKEHKGVVSVIKEAIMGKGTDAYVFVVNGKAASMRKVRLGVRQGPDIEIRDGLSAGDEVVIMGQQRLRDGAEVIAEE